MTEHVITYEDGVPITRNIVKIGDVLIFDSDDPLVSHGKTTIHITLIHKEKL